MALAIFGQDSDPDAVAIGVSISTNTPVAGDRVVMCLMCETDDLDTDPLTDVTGLTVDGSSESDPLVYYAHDTESASGQPFQIVWLSYVVTSAMATEIDALDSFTIGGTATGVGTTIEALHAGCVWYVSGNSSLSTHGFDGNMHGSTPTDTESDNVAATVASGGAMLVAGGADGTTSNNNILSLTAVYTGADASGLLRKREVNDGLWAISRPAYALGAGGSESVTWSIDVVDTAGDDISNDFVGYLLLTEDVGGGPASVDPDRTSAQINYTRLRARARALPNYLDTGLLRGLDV